MLLDVQNILDDNVAVTATAASTHTYNTGSIGDIGIGEGGYLVVQVGTAFAGTSTLTISIETDDNTAFSSPATVIASRAFTVAEMTAGKQLLNMPIPMGCEQYIRMKYTVSSTAFSAGTITSAICTAQAQASRSYPSAINVSNV